MATITPGRTSIDDKGDLSFADIFQSGRLSTDAATTELQEEIPRIPGDLVAKEYSCRRRLANTLSACCIAEMQGQEESEGIVKFIPKILFPNSVEDMFYWVKAKQACRYSVLSKFRDFHETSSLLKGPILGSTLLM